MGRCRTGGCAVCNPELRDYRPGAINRVGEHTQWQIFEAFYVRLPERFNPIPLSIGG